MFKQLFIMRMFPLLCGKLRMGFLSSAFLLLTVSSFASSAGRHRLFPKTHWLTTLMCMRLRAPMILTRLRLSPITFRLNRGRGLITTDFGANVRYEIHIKNKTTTKGDDITYRFTFLYYQRRPKLPSLTFA